MKNSAKSFAASRKIKILYFSATLLLFAAVACGILSGSTQIGADVLINVLQNGAAGVAERIFLFVRLPRTLACITVGAALSVSGLIIQSVLANKLASPSIIGVNSGAGLAVVIAATFGICGGLQLSALSFFGALAVALAVSAGAKKWGASRSTVILMGVAVNSLMNGIADAVIAFNPDIAVMSRDFKIGDFSSVTYNKLIPAAVITVISFVILLTLSKDMDVLSLGDESAAGLGVDVGKMRIVFLLFAALMSGCAVSVAGLISFVGLLVPHAIRRFGVTDSFHLIPLCALFGGSFTCLCDTAARTLFSPYEIPVGIIMSLLGAPFFLFMLIRGKGGRENA